MEAVTERPAQPAPKGRFAVNLLSNVGTFGFSLLIGFWYTPFLVTSLGTAAYGMIPLANSVVIYFSLATMGLNTAVGRYLTLALERGDRQEANKIFNASLFGTAAIGTVLLVPIALFAVFIDRFLQIPAGQTGPVQTLFLLTAGSFLVSTFASPFSVATYSRNRFDIRGGIATAETITRIGVVVLLFLLFSPNLTHVGIGLAAASVVTLGGAIWSWRRLTPELSIAWNAHDWTAFREISTTGGWVIVNQIGAILFLNIDLLVINRLLGPEEGGRYAALLQLSMLIRNLGGTVAGVFGPTIMQLVAQDNREKLVEYSQQSIRIMAILMALPIGLVCGFSRPLLTLWLGPSFTDLWPLLVLMVLPLTINLAILPLFSINIAMDSLKLPGYITLVLGIINLTLAWYFGNPEQYGLFGVAAAGAVVLTCKNALFIPYYAARVLGERSTRFFKHIGLCTLLGAVLAIALFELDRWLVIALWPSLIATSVVSGLTYVAIVYGCLLTARERLLLRAHLGVAQFNPS